MNQPRHVVVVGAGYAGVMAANRILAARPPGVTVTVVNPRADFVERIRLHQYAADSGTATVPLAEVLHPDARVRVASVELIGERELTLADGEVLGFDHLVYAVGSGTAGGPDGAEHAFTVGGFEDADRLRTRLRELSDGATVVVVGGGLTGIEAAAEIAERRPDLLVRLASAGAVGVGLAPRGRRSVARTLGSLGVDVRAGARVRRIEPDRVVLADGSDLAADCVVWAGAFAVPDLARRSGLPVDAGGRLRTDENLVCLGNPAIVGVGDAVAPPEAVAGHIRMSCQAALPLGAHGADTVLAQLAGRNPEPLSMGFLLQCVSLGRRAGVVQFVRTDDSPRKLALRGRMGAFVKEQICRQTVSKRGARAGSYRWLSGPAPAREEQGVPA
ncbi:NAD(P)/FAD-dependent oxidoreductase [Rhodococcus sp. NPDC127528]|uniref:NAD(P)/FAD-dependent oxidoreductase n=1 Tax=unclassified Rhodococcus (in: high G+C Gram-positive bacteria) TaxID=192944 RepID=UPI00362C45D5